MSGKIKTIVAVTGALAISAAAADAMTVTYNGFSNTAGLSMVGNAGTAVTGDGTVLRLTGAATDESGAAYSTSPITLGSNGTFSTQFQFRFSSPGGIDPADGITFVLAASPSGLGGVGNQLGYSGVGHSVAIEFDTFNNDTPGTSNFLPNEPNSSNHVAIDTNGMMTDTAAKNIYGIASCGFTNGNPPQNPNTAAGCMSNGDLWTANISYNGSTLDATLMDPAKGSTFTVYSNYAIDIGGLLGTDTAFVGFTGSTGLGWENHDIINWQFANTTELAGGGSTVPEPATLMLFGAGLAGAAAFRRKRASKR